MPSSVLVVDDDPGFRATARRLVDAAGLRIVGEAASVAAATRAAVTLRPHAALVDVGLPDGDGVALAAQLAALPWAPRVLLTSADPDAAGLVDVARSGAAGFVAKQDLPDAPLGRLLGDDAIAGPDEDVARDDGARA